MPPSATVRPGGSPRLIADGIVIEQVAEPATVEGVDLSARTLTLSMPGVALSTYRIGRGVSDWGDIRVGDRVRATIRDDLSVYVAPADESAEPRVLIVDPSYRVLTVWYPNGHTEAFKFGLHTRTQGIEAGDSVTIRPLDVIRLRAR